VLRATSPISCPSSRPAPDVLIDYRVPFMLVGIGVNAVGIFAPLDAFTGSAVTPEAKDPPTARDERCAVG
jgi:hypothetical protein